MNLYLSSFPFCLSSFSFNFGNSFLPWLLRLRFLFNLGLFFQLFLVPVLNDEIHLLQFLALVHVLIQDFVPHYEVLAYFLDTPNDLLLFFQNTLQFVLQLVLHYYLLLYSLDYYLLLFPLYRFQHVLQSVVEPVLLIVVQHAHQRVL